MVGLGERLAELGAGSLVLALAVAVLLGLRHATDPDHLTAVATLILGDERHGLRRAAGSGSPGASATGPRCSRSGCRSSW